MLMKCLPNCQNIDFSDRRFRQFWERMAEAGLPLLAHTGGEHTVPVINAALADPRLLRFPLECGVTVIAAHCATKSGAFDPDYFDAWVAMLARIPESLRRHQRDDFVEPLRTFARLFARRNRSPDFARERFPGAGAGAPDVAARLDRPRHFPALPEHPQFAGARLAIQARARIFRRDCHASGGAAADEEPGRGVMIFSNARLVLPAESATASKWSWKTGKLLKSARDQTPKRSTWVETISRRDSSIFTFTERSAATRWKRRRKRSGQSAIITPPAARPRCC